MLINHSIPNYCRPVVTSSVRQQLFQKALDLVGPKVVWIAIGKVLLLFVPLMFLVNFWLSSSAERNVAAILAAEEGYYLHMDENIKLRAERARLYSPEHLNTLAAKQLALYVPEKGQVTRL